MVNNKGYVKTLEAVIAIVVVLLFIFAFSIGNIGSREETPSIVKESQKFILKSISLNNTLRDDVLSEDSSRINTLIETNLPFGYSYKVQFCSLEICNILELPSKNIYIDSLYVTDGYKSKILKLYVWEG